MPLIKKHINFMGKRKLALMFSIALVVISLAAIVMRGLNLGIDFTGGTLLEVGYQQPADLDNIRKTLSDAGYDNATAQYFGSSNEVLIRLAPREGEDKADIGDKIMSQLKQVSNGEAEQRRIEFVGPQIGEELRDDGGLAMIYALAGILIYVALRFEFRFSLGAIIALVHDVVIVIGFFALTQIEFDLTVLAAVLAVIGYSLNDTIVVYDRIRENFRMMRKGSSEEIVNTSINHTLARTLMTSFTTAIVLLALFFVGGEVIHSFSIALLVGVVIGTYSSIYVASSAILMMGISKEDLLPPEKDTSELDKIP
ncbi:MAG TPA: protein translocase subunit SecF [Chromatiales bacterium]|nr:protein translocase subunit SecF [Thiotrichales bacterium]HIP68098.1 protein translocase subunit SecF [Chromatiales bacterium]